MVVAVLFRSTVLGFMFDVVGRNRGRDPCRIAGRAVGGTALVLSGGFAGLAGANDVLGIQGLFKANWDPGYGFTAFALVYLARLNAVCSIPFAFFFSFLLVGGDSMPRRADVPTYYVEMLEGLMLIFFAVAVYLERRYVPRGCAVAEETESVVSPPAMPGERDGRWSLPMNGIDLTDFMAAMLATGFLRAVPLVLAAIGEAVAEKAGLLNLGIEGMMLSGCFFGF